MRASLCEAERKFIGVDLAVLRPYQSGDKIAARSQPEPLSLCCASKTSTRSCEKRSMRMANTILIGGGSGLIGTHLSEVLTDRGDKVRLLTRTPDEVQHYPSYAWDANAGTIDEGALEGVTHVINLAGAGIADGRWTDSRKKLIIDSRTTTTALLARAIKARGKEVKAYISASAIGYYGDRGERLLQEDDLPGSGFLSKSTEAWEYAIGQLAGLTGVRTCALRTGIVLTPEGGALAKMLQPAQFGLSGYFGDGQQWYSWIHIDDIVGLYLGAIDDSNYEGPINAVAPQPVRNKEFAQVLAKAVSNPALSVPVPKLAMQLVFGEMSHTILDSTKVSARKSTEELGYEFAFPNLEPAMHDLLEKA